MHTEKRRKKRWYWKYGRNLKGKKQTDSIQIKAKRKGKTKNEKHNRNFVKKMEKTDT